MERRKTTHGMSLISMLLLLGSGAAIYKVVTPPKNDQGEIVGQSPLEGMFNPAQGYQAVLQIKELSKAIELYMVDLGDYPSQLQDLIKKPIGQRHWFGPYMRVKKIPHDPWGVDYYYTYPGQHYAYDLYSYGSDKVKGSANGGPDITNWKIQADSTPVERESAY